METDQMARVTPWTELANAVVPQAVREYRTLRKTLEKHPNRTRAIHQILELLDFFYGDWYSLLTEVEPGYLLRKLEEENHRITKEAADHA